MSENKFSDRLSEALKASGKTQTEIAKMAGITAPYLSDLKKGNKGNPSQEVLKKLADSLGTTPAWLMSYRDNAGIYVVGQPGQEHAGEPIVATSKGNPNNPETGFKAAGLINAWEKLAQEDELTDRTLAASAGRRKAIEELVHERLEEMCMQEFPGISLLIEDCTEAMKRFDLWVKAYRAKTLASKEQSEKIEP